MSEFYEFRNSCGRCCPTDDNGDLIMPDRPPMMRDVNGNFIDSAPSLPTQGPFAAQNSGRTAASPMPNPSNAPNPNAAAEQSANEDAWAAGFATPPQVFFDDDAFEGSMQQILADNLGQFVVCEFLIGTESMVRREGILYTVGRSYITLYDETTRQFIVCDIFSIKFVTFFFPGERPQGRNANPMQNTPTTNRRPG